MGKTNARMLRFLIVGFVFLWIAKTFSDRGADGHSPSILIEGLAISGWVFIWEAVSLFFFTNHECYHRYRTYKRLQDAPTFFHEAKTEVK